MSHMTTFVIFLWCDISKALTPIHCIEASYQLRIWWCIDIYANKEVWKYFEKVILKLNMVYVQIDFGEPCQTPNMSMQHF